MNSIRFTACDFPNKRRIFIEFLDNLLDAWNRYLNVHELGLRIFMQMMRKSMFD